MELSSKRILWSSPGTRFGDRTLAGSNVHCSPTRLMNYDKKIHTLSVGYRERRQWPLSGRNREQEDHGRSLLKNLLNVFSLMSPCAKSMRPKIANNTVFSGHKAILNMLLASRS